MSRPRGYEEAAAELAEVKAERDMLLAVLKLAEHKLITCGVAASNPDPTLTTREKCYAEKWNSPQAEAVRALRADRDDARAELAKVAEQRDELLAAVMDGTAEFTDWVNCVADQIEGQENEVCLDHNRMLAALLNLRRKAKHASGADSSHSAAGDAQSEESNADANNRQNRDPEGAHLEQQRRATGDGDPRIRAGLREPDGVPGCGQSVPADQRQAVRNAGAGDAVPVSAGDAPIGAGGVLATTQLNAVRSELAETLRWMQTNPTKRDGGAS